MFLEAVFTFLSIPEMPQEGSEEYKNIVINAFLFVLAFISYIAFAPKCINPFYFDMDHHDKSDTQDKKSDNQNDKSDTKK